MRYENVNDRERDLVGTDDFRYRRRVFYGIVFCYDTCYCRNKRRHCTLAFIDAWTGRIGLQ